MFPHLRVARPPAEGRGRNQLLPWYWPRITDQELQQISGDSNSTIVPLFEKVLSASDVGRIGRLVLPKAWNSWQMHPHNRTMELKASSGGSLGLALLCKALFPMRVPITIALASPVTRALSH
uniref:Uncharacterized protein n=1 Tax=Zea mays TaxID=4577 RepID=A0A804NS25_MAIZE